MLPPIPETVRALERLPVAERLVELRRLLGQASLVSAELDWRAQLVTALREAELYPACHREAA